MACAVRDQHRTDVRCVEADGASGGCVRVGCPGPPGLAARPASLPALDRGSSYDNPVPSTRCGWCGRHSNMRKMADAVKLTPKDFYRRILVTGPFKCDYCGRVLVASLLVDDTSFNAREPGNSILSSLDGQIQWVPAIGAEPSEFPGTPEHIADAAQEAQRCHSIKCYRSAAMTARAVVEATAKNKGFTEGNLDKKINDMAAAGLIRPLIAAAAHQLRLFGNDMAHGDFAEPVSEEESDDALKLMTELLNEIYGADLIVRNMASARAAKKAAKKAAPVQPAPTS